MLKRNGIDQPLERVRNELTARRARHEGGGGDAGHRQGIAQRCRSHSRQGGWLYHHGESLRDAAHSDPSNFPDANGCYLFLGCIG